MKTIILIPLLVTILSNCSTTPSGRKQLKLISSAQMIAMGDQSFTSLKKAQKLSQNRTYLRRVSCITNRLLKAMGETPSNWSIEVFQNSEPNAFALPGNNMGVHTGMIELVNNNDQLAAVIGHEIGHVLAHHGNERVSQTIGMQLGLAATQLYLGRGTQKDRMILGALGVGAQFGVLLPFSRTHESEADALGIKFMAKAGFDPRQAAGLWKIMKEKSNARTPEFFSTHPSPQTRIERLEALSPKYRPLYENNRSSIKCY